MLDRLEAVLRRRDARLRAAVAQIDARISETLSAAAAARERRDRLLRERQVCAAWRGSAGAVELMRKRETLDRLGRHVHQALQQAVDAEQHGKVLQDERTEKLAELHRQMVRREKLRYLSEKGVRA
jgi:hypothetical protein